MNAYSEFELCSDRMERLYPEYELDEENHFVPGPDANVIDLNFLKTLLLSQNDDENYRKLKKLTENDKCSFLDPSIDQTGQRIAFQSFPRSGNTFLRRYIERITGVYTGADMCIDHTFHEAMMGLLGQNIVGDSNRVWITKTHKPQDIPNSKSFSASRMIVIARNPIDVFPSFAGLINLNSHSLEPEQQYHVDFPKFWDGWVT